jgi:hypothetical protein
MILMNMKRLMKLIATGVALTGCGEVQPVSEETARAVQAEATRLATSKSAVASEDDVTVECDRDWCIIVCGNGGACVEIPAEVGRIWMCGC